MIIRELPQGERPREKMLFHGTEHLSDSELLAILLRTGTKDKSAIALADEILRMDKKGMLFLEECTPEELSKVKGMGIAKSCQVLAAIELGKRMATSPRRKRSKIQSTQDVVDFFMEEMRYYKKEFFYVLLVNAKGEIIAVDNTAIGDLCSSIVHPREVFSRAVKKSAAAVIFVHNHPSGNPEPSEDDIKTTRRLVKAGDILGINVLDHVIIGDGTYISMRSQKLI